MEKIFYILNVFILVFILLACISIAIATIFIAIIPSALDFESRCWFGWFGLMMIFVSWLDYKILQLCRI